MTPQALACIKCRAVTAANTIAQHLLVSSTRSCHALQSMLHICTPDGNDTAMTGGMSGTLHVASQFWTPCASTFGTQELC